jgi:tRNA(fMet)-specific endonuclease VapC
VNQDFSLRPVLPFDEAATDEFLSQLRANTRVGSMDLKIAAIVLARNEVLVSANVRDFRRVPRLRVEDWTKP